MVAADAAVKIAAIAGNSPAHCVEINGQWIIGKFFNHSTDHFSLNLTSNILHPASNIYFIMFSEIVEAEGHLVDSQILSKIMDRVIECGAAYEVLDFYLGRTNEDISRLKMQVNADSQDSLEKTLEELVELGCYPDEIANVTLKPAEADRVVPDDFYSTTNHRTFVRYGDQWLEVAKQRMDGVIVIAREKNYAECRKLRDVRQDEIIVCGVHGIKIQPEFKERDRLGFAFMANDISSERRAETSVIRIAEMMKRIKASKEGRIVFVAGPVVIHTGGVNAFSEIIRKGYVDALLAGNAIAVHDIEHALYGTSLGVDLEHGVPLKKVTKITCERSMRLIATAPLRAQSKRDSSNTA